MGVGDVVALHFGRIVRNTFLSHGILDFLAIIIVLRLASEGVLPLASLVGFHFLAIHFHAIRPQVDGDAGRALTVLVVRIVPGLRAADVNCRRRISIGNGHRTGRTIFNIHGVRAVGGIKRIALNSRAVRDFLDGIGALRKAGNHDGRFGRVRSNRHRLSANNLVAGDDIESESLTFLKGDALEHLLDIKPRVSGISGGKLNINTAFAADNTVRPIVRGEAGADVVGTPIVRVNAQSNVCSKSSFIRQLGRQCNGIPHRIIFRANLKVSGDTNLCISCIVRARAGSSAFTTIDCDFYCTVIDIGLSKAKTHSFAANRSL